MVLEVRILSRLIFLLKVRIKIFNQKTFYNSFTKISYNYLQLSRTRDNIYIDRYTKLIISILRDGICNSRYIIEVVFHILIPYIPKVVYPESYPTV